MRVAAVAAVAVLLGTAHGSDEATRKGPPPHGADECPCLGPADSRYAAMRAQLAAAGYPDGYGMEGCKAYDEKSLLMGCHVANPPEFCRKPWCYVDMELCPMDADKCAAQGGLVGSEISPFCRQRDHEVSIVQKDTVAAAAHQNLTVSQRQAFYSYATCGAVDVYGPKLLEKSIGKRHVKMSISPGVISFHALLVSITWHEVHCLSPCGTSKCPEECANSL